MANTAVLRLMAGLCGLACTLTAGTAPEVTYSRDVAPILFKNCVGCHRPNDIAPMSLLSYREARPWAAAIRQAVVRREMPPWHADPHFGKFANDPRLTDAEIETIAAWVTGGAKEGSPADLPPAPVFNDKWKVGRPDKIVDIGQDYVVKSAAVPDEYTYFEVDPHFTKDTWVKAVELRPGNKRVVHHAHVWMEAPVKPKGESSTGRLGTAYLFKDNLGLAHVRSDAPIVENGCAVEENDNLSERSDAEGPLGSYLPGKGPDLYPEGTAKLVPAGSKLKFQLHYNNASGTTETDRTEVGFIFADAPPAHPLWRFDSSAYLFLIPPGAANQEVKHCSTFQKDVLLMSYVAHMHFRGKDMRFELQRPGRARETVLFVPHYSFAWQQNYRLAEPLRVEKGTRLIITAHFDNSPNNKWNPDPTQTIRWGEPSTSEMMDGWVEYIDVGSEQHPQNELSSAHR